MPDDVRKVLIIGSGPAGLTAAIYTARAQLEPLLIEGETVSNTDQPGGQLMLTTEVENYPGFADGIMGPDLMATMREQALRFETEIVTKRVTRVDLSARPYGVWTDDSDTVEPTHRADAIIIATGAQALMLGLEHEQRLLGHGVSTCATCDAFFFRGQHIAVVGGGDSAMEEATFLSRFAESVTIIHRREELRASKIMQQRAMDDPKISFAFNKVVTDVHGTDRVEGLALRDTVTGETSELEVTGLFVAIGHKPSTDLFKGQLELRDNGYIRVHDGTRTSVAGVFAAGDVYDDHYRQAVTAAGSGCMAALDAEHWLAAGAPDEDW